MEVVVVSDLILRPAVWRSVRTTWILGGLALLAAAAFAAFGLGTGTAGISSSTAAPVATGIPSPALTQLATEYPQGRVSVIVQMARDSSLARGHSLVANAGGRVTRDLRIINGFGARMTAQAAERLARTPGVHAVSLNSVVRHKGGVDDSRLATAYPNSVNAGHLWDHYTGEGVGVAVIDTGIDGDLPDFQESMLDRTSRVVAAVTVNPNATTPNDTYGHGTHVAGILAGNSWNLSLVDTNRGRYIGTAPNANLISIKVSDDDGATTVLDVIAGVQFAVDHKSDYNIRVINLSLESTQAESYKTDPLDAAVEAAWFKGIVVVAAAGNRGTADDAVQRAPGNDPYVITVGAVDDQGTKNQDDDVPAAWGSVGTTQDGVAKPDIVAPGAHMVSTLAPDSTFETACPSCVVGKRYIRAGGTSMAAPVVSGIVADILQKHPEFTPNQVKGALVKTAKPLKRGGIAYREIDGDKAKDEGKSPANAGLTPNALVDPATGEIDYARASWSRASWSEAAESLRASWSRASWSCVCAPDVSGDGTADPTRASWSRASWSRASWSTSWEK
jgi:serine protease AprX